MYFVLLIAVSGILIWTAIAQGARAAVAWGWMAALILPTWINRSVGAIQLNLRTSIGLVAVLCLVFCWPANTRWRWMWADLLAILLVTVQVFSLSQNDDFRVSTLITTSCRWLLPYFLGRLAYQSVEDKRNLTRVAATACLVLAVWAVFESTTRINPAKFLAGIPSYLGPDGIRWGLKRAWGPLHGPILFGMMLVAIMPWALEAARLAKRQEGPRWWRWLPWLIGLAIVSTISRGAILALIACGAAAVFFYSARLRGVTLALMLIGLLLAVVERDRLMLAMQDMVGGKSEIRSFVVIDGEPYAYSASRYRLLLFQVYRDAMVDAGWFGHGRLGEDYFSPVEGPLGERFASIDNHYILLILTSGYLGLAAFLLFVTAVLFNLCAVAAAQPPEDRLLTGAMVGALGGIIVMMITVWFSHDYAYLWLFSAGLGVSWRAETYFAASLRPVRRWPVRQLVPGHPAMSQGG